MSGLKRTVIGVLAHVDAGKTTLSEAMLYCSGTIRTRGRVDHGDAYLDTFALERQRGITIFSKQAVLQLPGLQATLLDTPGHADFSAETERTLGVLDCAILVISAPEGVQSHTETLWKLLHSRRIPVLVFINKTDLPYGGREKLLEELNEKLGGGFYDAARRDCESAALADEGLLEEYLASGTLSPETLRRSTAEAVTFPCWFGAALRLDGVEDFLHGIEEYAPATKARDVFAARVYKISRDEQGARLTHMKITGGVLHVRETVRGDGWEDKITQMRTYSGAKYTQTDQAYPGDIVAVMGLNSTRPGMGLGAEPQGEKPELEPVLAYSILLPDGAEVHSAMEKLQLLAEEDPQLHLMWHAGQRELRIRAMGKMQLEVLQQLVKERFGMDIAFGPGRILYRETISTVSEGIGHYEPLRHYAEVHLLLEPGGPGSGVQIASDCSTDELAENWQRLIMTHIAEKQHVGVLTGSPITDIRITLIAGRAHLKHTEGGDFRQATYRAIRQGLMQAEPVLLEPWYDFRLELPRMCLGRALADLQCMNARISAQELGEETAVITGSAAAAAVGEYAGEVIAYSHGSGKLSLSLCGYAPCADQEKTAEAIGYDPEADTENTADSVFCRHGAGFAVKWSEVPGYAHIPPLFSQPAEEEDYSRRAARYCAGAASDDELMAIFERTYGPVRDRMRALHPVKKASEAPMRPWRERPAQELTEYVLVDGYNIIFAWDDLKKIAVQNLDAARGKLIDRLRNYQGFRQCPVIVVFDAYKVRGNPGSVEHLGGLSVVYTKEAETADMYIEKATYDLSKKHRVRVATSDGLEQIIILGHGALRISADAFEEEVRQVEDAIRSYLEATE